MTVAIFPTPRARHFPGNRPRSPCRWWGTRPARPETRGYTPGSDPCSWPFAAGRTGAGCGSGRRRRTAVRTGAGWSPFPGSRPWPCCRRRFQRSCRRRWRGRCGAGPGTPPGRRRCWCGPPRCCPSARRQTHVQAAGGQGGMGIFGKQPVQLGRLGQADGIAGAGVRQAEAVHDDQGSRRLVHCGTSCRFA